MRWPAMRNSRSATSFGSEGERRTSKRNCTAVESLLTFCPPGPEERTKLSSSSDSSMLMVSVTRIIFLIWSGSCAGEIALRQHLAFFHRRLVERIDAEEMRGDDCLQHEMHEQLAEACFVEIIDMNGADWAAVL